MPIPSISSQQTVEQIEIIQEVDLQDVSKVNDSVMNKNKEIQYSFLQKKYSRKRKMD